MKPKRRVEMRTYLVLILCLASAALLAAVVQGTELGGERISPVETLQEIEELVFPIALGLWIAVGAYLCYLYLTSRRAKVRPGRHQGSPASSQGIILLLAILFLAAIFSAQGAQDLFNADPNDNGEDPANVTTVDPASNRGAANGFVIAITVALMVILLVPLTRFALNRSAWKFVDRDTAQPTPIATVESAIQEITFSTGDELRDSVLKAYHSMLRLLNGRVAEERMLTPREFASRSVDELGWPRDAVNDLTEVFELARYSHHPLGEVERMKALDSLESIRGSATKGADRAG